MDNKEFYKSRFRPLIGDYFFIALKNALTLHDLTNVFPSPY